MPNGRGIGSPYPSRPHNVRDLRLPSGLLCGRRYENIATLFPKPVHVQWAADQFPRRSALSKSLRINHSRIAMQVRHARELLCKPTFTAGKSCRGDDRISPKLYMRGTIVPSTESRAKSCTRRSRSRGAHGADGKKRIMPPPRRTKPSLTTGTF